MSLVALRSTPPTVRFGVLALVLGALVAMPARAADTEPFRLGISLAYSYERFHSPAADSLGFSLTRALQREVDIDFRVMDLPLGADKPSLHLFGHALVTRRAFATGDLVGAGVVTPAVDEVPIADVGGGLALHIPMTIIDPSAGSALYLGYGGGLVLASTTGYDFIRIQRGVFGFERTRGFFQGSLVEVTYGRNETYGLAFASKRYTTRLHIEGQLGPYLSRAPAPVAAKPGAPAAAGIAATGGAAAPAAKRGTSPIHVFVELTIDSDGRAGPDGLKGLAGVSLDAGGILRRVMGAID